MQFRTLLICLLLLAFDSAPVVGGTRGGSDSLFNGIHAPAKEFAYPAVTGPMYALWAAQDKVGVKVFVVEKSGGTYKLVTDLTGKSFAGTAAVQHIETFIASARALHGAVKTKQAAAGTNAVPDLEHPFFTHDRGWTPVKDGCG